MDFRGGAKQLEVGNRVAVDVRSRLIVLYVIMREIQNRDGLAD